MTCASKNKFKGGREKDWLDDYLLTRDAFRDEVCVWGGLWWEWFLLYTLLHTTIYTKITLSKYTLSTLSTYKLDSQNKNTIFLIEKTQIFFFC